MPKLALGGVFDVVINDSRPGILTFRATGKGATTLFQQEAGGHRWQRVPTTEKKGRVHTSTVTVAVMKEAQQAHVQLDWKDLEIRTCRGSGAGGQHRNKTESAVQITHIPTGVSVRCENERSQHQNREEALKMLQARLLEQAQSSVNKAHSQERKDQVGSGMRGDKSVTIAVQRDSVQNHNTNKSTTYQRYRKGHLEDLW